LNQDQPDGLDDATPPPRRMGWHTVLMIVAIGLVVVTFIAAMWAAARTFQLR
jgi:hypothetical protein